MPASPIWVELIRIVAPYFRILVNGLNIRFHNTSLFDGQLLPTWHLNGSRHRADSFEQATKSATTICFWKLISLYCKTLHRGTSASLL